MSRLHAPIVAAMFLSGCGEEPEEALLRALRSRAGDDSAESFCLAEVASFPWDRVLIVNPYTSAEQVERTLGSSWSESSAIDLRDDEGSAALVFAEGRRVVLQLRVARTDVDLAQSRRGQVFSLPRSDARLQRVLSPDGRRGLSIAEGNTALAECH
jgi:hypothetical protein